jgi:hypothetical protein
MIRLVTVTGVRTNTLWHQLNHYKDLVDEMYIAVYDSPDNHTYDEVLKIVNQFPTAKIVDRIIEEKYNWERVTQLYNKTKMLYPNDWWVIADDDELHVYSKPLLKIVEECEVNGWDIVRGGFIDRIGPDGIFPEINNEEDIFKQFPLAGFFRYPMSRACPNKICITKGYVEITPGQHYAKINGQTTWRWQGWNHPLIAPTKEYNVQVHHFKWDSTCGDRIRTVANTNKDYAYSEEYRIMYRQLAKCKFKIDIENPEFMIENDGFREYGQWNKLFNIIQSI